MYYPQPKQSSGMGTVILVLLLCVGLWYVINNPGVLRSLSAGVSSVASGDSVQGAPSISAKKIDSVLCGAGSPMCGSGQALYNQGVAAGINPAYALAWFHHESSYGTAGMARATHSLGNLICYKGAAWCYQGFAGYNSWLDGSQAWYNLIAGPVYVGAGLRTVSAIIHKYAPGANGNDESAYVAAVESDVRAWSA